MKHHLKFSNSYLLFILFLICACGSANEHKQACGNANDTVLTVEKFKIDFPKDSIQDRIAELLAGNDVTYFEKNFSDSLKFWNDYKMSIDTPWTRITNERLSKMDNWSKSEISPKINDTCLLFYPFSGPDFLNAFHLFPNANDYVMVAMEKLGTIPNLEQLSEKDMKKYLNDVNHAIRDIYKRSYFITGNMEQDMAKHKIEGVLPLLYVFLQRTGHKIYEFGYYQLNNDATTFTKIDKPSNSLNTSECIKFIFLKEGENKLKTLTYFYADISDSGFDKNPTFLKYLKQLEPYNSFLKSASYLSHYATFSNIRNIVLANANSVLQDDTGIPFRYFVKDWTCHFYGEYSAPIEDFKNSGYLYQKDLDEKYKTEKVKSLDFSLGYHWRSGKQNWVLYVHNTR